MSRLMIMVLLLGLGLAASCKAEEAGDDSTFIKDVTYPDGTKVKPGQELVKKWEVINTGSVTWEGRLLKAIESSAGKDDLKTIKQTKITRTQPGEKCILEAKLTSPADPGLRYKVTFKMVDESGKEYFPKKAGVYIDVIVQ